MSVERIRHGVQQEPPNELIGSERHHLGLAVMAIVFPGEVDLVSMPIELSPKVPAENSPLRYASIASKPTRRLDVSEDIKIELDDGLESLGGGAVTKAVGQGVAPGGVFGLQGEQFGDGVVPSLRSGASVRRTAIADGEWRLLGLPAGAISGLSLGVAEGVVTYRLAASWHGVFSVT
jgi:hypothetical protein